MRITRLLRRIPLRARDYFRLVAAKELVLLASHSDFA